jgi:ribosome modulation factor
MVDVVVETMAPAPQELDEAEAIRAEGMRAFTAGRLVSACPYPEATPQHEAWVSGWFDISHAVGQLPDD